MYCVVTDNIGKDKNKHNYAIEYEPNLDDKFNLSSGTKDPLTVETVRLRGGKKYKDTMTDRLTYLCDSGDNNSMIKRNHTKHYAHKMRSNKVEYITDAGAYFTTDDIKANFIMP